jgi:hypothetical protein
MGYSNMSFEERSNWVGDAHGVHIRYMNKTTLEVVEAPCSKIKERTDVEKFFLWIFINSSPSFELVASFFNKKEQLLVHFLDEHLSEDYFLGREFFVPEINVGDILELRASAFDEAFQCNGYWDLKYYYEDVIKSIYWTIENDKEVYGTSLPTVLGGTKTKVIAVIEEAGVISKIYTDLYVIEMPYAYEKNQFKLIDSNTPYEKDRQIEAYISDLSFYEENSKNGLFNPLERENNKIVETQRYYTTKYNKRKK